MYWLYGKSTPTSAAHTVDPAPPLGVSKPGHPGVQDVSVRNVVAAPFWIHSAPSSKTT